jgi:hypothetical protein
VHPRAQLERFVELYRKAGGQVDLELSEGAADAFAARKPSPAPSPTASRTIEKMAAFVRANTR